jgi:hypothetical protein
MPTETWRIANEFMDRHIESISTDRPCGSSIDVGDMEVIERSFRLESNLRVLGAGEMPDYAARRSAVSAQKTALA